MTRSWLTCGPCDSSCHSLVVYTFLLRFVQHSTWVTAPTPHGQRQPPSLGSRRVEAGNKLSSCCSDGTRLALRLLLPLRPLAAGRLAAAVDTSPGGAAGAGGLPVHLRIIKSSGQLWNDMVASSAALSRPCAASDDFCGLLQPLLPPLLTVRLPPPR